MLAELHEMMREPADRLWTIPRRPRVHLQRPGHHRLSPRLVPFWVLFGFRIPTESGTDEWMNEWTGFMSLLQGCGGPKGPGGKTDREWRRGRWAIARVRERKEPRAKRVTDIRGGNKGSNRCPGTHCTDPMQQNPRVWREVRLLPGTSGRC